MKSKISFFLMGVLVASQTAFAEGGIPVENYNVQASGISLTVESTTYQYRAPKKQAEDPESFHGLAKGSYVKERNLRLYPRTSEEGCITGQTDELQEFLKAPASRSMLQELGVKHVVVSAYGFDDDRLGTVVDPVKNGFLGNGTYRLALRSSRDYRDTEGDCKLKSSKALGALFQSELVAHKDAVAANIASLNSAPANQASAKVADPRRKLASDPDDVQSVDPTQPNANGFHAYDGR